MADFRLGIIGGCLSHQPGVPHSALYHRQLADRLAAGNPETRLRVRIARHFTRPAVERLKVLQEEGPLDAVLLHVRNTVAWRTGLLVTVPSERGLRYYLHPFLLRPWKLGWAAVEERNFAGCLLVADRRIAATAPEPPPHGDRTALMPGATRLAGIRVRDLIYGAGALFRLDAWAIRDELKNVRDVIVHCRAAALPLLVLGPTRQPGEFWADRFCRRLERELAARLAAADVPFCSLGRAHEVLGDRLFRPDRFHLSAEAHGYVAEQLARHLPVPPTAGRLSGSG